MVDYFDSTLFHDIDRQFSETCGHIIDKHFSKRSIRDILYSTKMIEEHQGQFLTLLLGIFFAFIFYP